MLLIGFCSTGIALLQLHTGSDKGMHGSVGCFPQTKLYKTNVTNANVRSIKAMLREATIFTAVVLFLLV